MNKKIVTLILVILISFCFLSIVVADNATNDDNNTADHDKTIDDDKDVDKDKTIDKDKKVNKNKTIDKKKATHKNKTNDKSKKNYIIAKGKGNDITFSDGFRGFILDYSKPPASPGDKFKRVSSSHASNANTLKLGIIECYKLDSAGQIGKIVSDFVKTGSSNTKVGKAVAASHEKVGDHAVVKINSHTEAIFDFEVLKSVSGNESDYFAYKVAFRTINDAKKDINQTNNVTNVTNTTNVTNKTNGTNITHPIDNATNATAPNGLFDNLASVLNALYDAWKPIIDTLMNNFLLIATAMESLADLFEGFMMEIQSLMYALGELLKMLDALWKELDGLLKLLSFILNALEQLLNLIEYLLNLLAELLAFLQELLDFLYSLWNFLLDLLHQLQALVQAIMDFLKSAGSFLINVIGNAAIIITSFVIITIGAFVYNRIR